jgi:hypothetical protein
VTAFAHQANPIRTQIDASEILNDAIQFDIERFEEFGCLKWVEKKWTQDLAV